MIRAANVSLKLICNLTDMLQELEGSSQEFQFTLTSGCGKAGVMTQTFPATATTTTTEGRSCAQLTDDNSGAATQSESKSGQTCNREAQLYTSAHMGVQKNTTHVVSQDTRRCNTETGENSMKRGKKYDRKSLMSYVRLRELRQQTKYHHKPGVKPGKGITRNRKLSFSTLQEKNRRGMHAIIDKGALVKKGSKGCDDDDDARGEPGAGSELEQMGVAAKRSHMPPGEMPSSTEGRTSFVDSFVMEVDTNATGLTELQEVVGKQTKFSLSPEPAVSTSQTSREDHNTDGRIQRVSQEINIPPGEWFCLRLGVKVIHKSMLEILRLIDK